ncbi:MAG: hypothetical protein V3W20_11740 [Candidatus Neomarinimicrobiota bacterium]
MKIHDSVRLYENDNLFIEGKILSFTLLDGKIVSIEVDWKEYISIYNPEDLELEHRDGVWSWRPLTEGIVRIEPDYFSSVTSG